MDERFNVYFAGQVKAGADPGSVRAQLAKLFNANDATLDKLFSGTPQLIKRDCDRATAQKYQAAMERAGAVPVIKQVATTPTATSAAAPAPQPAAPRAMTAAEKIAALAAAPDEVRYRQSAQVATPPGATPAAAEASGDITLTPPGTAVLLESERSTPVVREIDTTGLALDLHAERLSDLPAAPPPAPDTSHLSMGAVGDSIPNLPSQAVPLAPNLDGLALSAAGTDFSDCAAPEHAPLELDLSAFAALPPGVASDEEQQRQPLPVAVPSTDHIALQD